ncbi:hypothetical protein QQF64_024698 [Cirrhinus molitorella]|uniref:Histidine kinase/HSP90-like ATPase domain-containing protein n=1 Tax=Cirrhinus molitorella TaxID=172907 RepID=A0ABR3NM01_9TELE
MLAQVMKCAAAGSVLSSSAIKLNVDGFRSEEPPHPSIQPHTSVHVTLHDAGLGLSVESASSYLAGRASHLICSSDRRAEQGGKAIFYNSSSGLSDGAPDGEEKFSSLRSCNLCLLSPTKRTTV